MTIPTPIPAVIVSDGTLRTTWGQPIPKVIGPFDSKHDALVWGRDNIRYGTWTITHIISPEELTP